MTVTTATQGAGDAGQGAVQVKFVTRSGTNNFTGSGYYYYRSDKLNANTWFNNRNGVAKAKLKQNQIGGRVGGPIVIPGLFDGHNKAFFFVNYEEFRQPSDTTRNRTMLNPAAAAGNFTYGSDDDQPAGAGGRATARPSTVDPTIGKMLSDIRAATGGRLDADDRRQPAIASRSTCRWRSKRIYPTFRLDYNLTTEPPRVVRLQLPEVHRLPGHAEQPRRQLPGLPGRSRARNRCVSSWSAPVRSVLTSNLVNEARVGYSGAPVKFFAELNIGMFSGTLAPQAGLRRSCSRPSARR